MRQLLTQLLETISAWTEAVRTLSSRIDVVASTMSDVSTDAQRAASEAKKHTSNLVLLRAAIGERNILLSEMGKDLVHATDELEEFTGKHKLVAIEPPRRWHVRVIRSVAEKGWPHAVLFLLHFAAASVGASVVLQHIVDAAITTIERHT